MSFTLNVIDDELLLDGDFKSDRPISQYKRCYTDINAHLFDPQTSKIHARVKSICYSVTREKAPIYTMVADPAMFNRGKRGISGKIIITWLDDEMISQDPVTWKPLDLVISLTNEYGQCASMGMLGIELSTLNGESIEKFGTGIYTFTARGLRSISPII